VVNDPRSAIREQEETKTEVLCRGRDTQSSGRETQTRGWGDEAFGRVPGGGRQGRLGRDRGGAGGVNLVSLRIGEKGDGGEVSGIPVIV